MKLKFRHLFAAATATLLIGASSMASAEWKRENTRVMVHPHHIVVKERFRGHRFVARDRVLRVIRARHIRYIGQPYIYGGRYVVRCYDTFGRLAYCSVDPYSGAFLGFRVRL